MSVTNGGSPRLDRIEKMIEQTVRATREAELANKKAHARIDSDLRRWAALGVKEARNQRKRIAKLDQESAEYRRRTDQNLAEITDKLNGLIGYVAGR